MHPSVLIIQGSYKESGMTVALTRSFTGGIKEAYPKAQVEEIFLKNTKIEFCEGCYECSNIQCKIDDGMNEILKKMIQANVLVYATPVYMYGPTALMKRFMERNYPVLETASGMPKSRLKKRDCIGTVILSSGAPPVINRIFGITYYPSKILKWLCRLWGCRNTYVLRAGGMESGNKAKAREVRKARDLGRTIGKELHNLYK
ncbi:MAG: flavodoxin family protein [Candidatus Woesearchaeota archaeon]